MNSVAILKRSVTVALFVLAFRDAVASPAKALFLQKLEGSERPSGCSCSITNSKNDYLLASDLLDKASVTIRAEGRKRDLKFVSSTEKKSDPKKGETFTRVYADGKLKLTLNYRTTFACPPDSESCEVTRYAIDGEISEGTRKNTFKTLKGECGC